LTKDPEQYADAKNQPHVLVAVRMKERGLTVRTGDTIAYIICHSKISEKPSSLAERAYHPDELRKDPANLSIDYEWYLIQQIHPPVARLCEHIDGTDSSRLASCLGLDPKKFTSSSSNMSGNGELRLTSVISEEEKFRDCERVGLICNSCKSVSQLESLITADYKVGVKCSACGSTFRPITVYYQVYGAIRKYLKEYYQGWLECDDPACRTQTLRMRVYESRCVNDQCRGTMSPKVSSTTILYFYNF